MQNANAHAGDGGDRTGPGYAAQIKTWLGDIMYGKEEHDWAYVIEEEGK